MCHDVVVSMALTSKLAFLLVCALVQRASSRKVVLPFDCISTHDYALDHTGFEPVQISELECGRRCMDSDSG